MAALIGNAFHLKQEEGSVAFYFDKTRANLIPMLKSGSNFQALEALVTEFFGQAHQIHFSIGNDPKLAEQRERETQAMRDVQDDPKIRFILDQFKGTIVHCQILEREED